MPKVAAKPKAKLTVRNIPCVPLLNTSWATAPQPNIWRQNKCDCTSAKAIKPKLLHFQYLVLPKRSACCLYVKQTSCRCSAVSLACSAIKRLCLSVHTSCLLHRSKKELGGPCADVFSLSSLTWKLFCHKTMSGWAEAHS